MFEYDVEYMRIQNERLRYLMRFSGDASIYNSRAKELLNKLNWSGRPDDDFYYMPSDAEINALAAEVCGWTEITPDCYTPSGLAWCGYVPEPHTRDNAGPWRSWRHYIPNYCIDIDKAKCLLPIVGEENLPAFHRHLIEVSGLPPDDFHSVTTAVVIITKNCPKLVTVAALKALGKWPEHWMKLRE